MTDANLSIILCLCYTTNALLALVMVVAGPRFRGAMLWVGGQGLLALGTLLDAIPLDLVPWIPLVIGNTAYVAAEVLFYHSVWVFRITRSFPRWIYVVLAFQLLTFALVAGSPYWVRSLLFSAWMALGSLATGVLLIWTGEDKVRFPQRLTAMPFFILGVASAVRVVLLSLSGWNQELIPLASLNVWYVSGAILLGNILLFGYFMMTRAKAQLNLSQKDALIAARNRKLEESNRAKDLFFSIIAHDLRGPIGGAARYVRKHLLGKMTGLEAKYPEVEVVASALEKTYDFLEKLLWWSRAQLQDWVPSRVPIDLAQILNQALDLNRSAADLKEMVIRLSPPPYPRPEADPDSVQMILGNLISNAVKFSLPGHHVDVKVGQSDGWCHVTVADSGVGMDPATLDRLFHIEDKLSTHGTSGERGSGMGLILAQSLAERNGCSITLESEPGHGTSATLRLPLGALEPPKPESPE